MTQQVLQKIPPNAARLSLRRVLVLLTTVIVLGYLAFIVNTYREGFANAARGDAPTFTDFTPTYGAALLLNQMPVEFVYHPDYITDANRQAGNAAYGNTLSEKQSRVGFSPFMYPPTFIPLIVPLGHLPYFVALFGWLTLTAVPYLLAVRAALQDATLGTCLALACPPFFYNLMYGQHSFLPAGLIGLGLTSLQQRPVLAGVLIGLASVKPHLGVLLPVALAAGGYWRSFLAATVTVVLLIACSLIAYGDEPWFAFIGISLFHLEGFEHNAYTWHTMPSVLSVSFLSGASLEQAAWIQGAAFLLCNTLVGYIWYRSRRAEPCFDLARAILCLAIPLAVPMIFLYDLAVIVPGLAFLIRDMRQHHAPSWQWALVAIAPACQLLVKPLGGMPGIHLAVGALLALLAVALVRWRAGLARS